VSAGLTPRNVRRHERGGATRARLPRRHGSSRPWGAGERGRAV